MSYDPSSIPSAAARRHLLRRRLAGIAVLLALSAPWTAPPAAAGRAGEWPASYAGRPLEEALLDLEARGLRLLFSDRVVRPEMRVEREPAASAPREVLDELLRPHGLAAREGPGGVLVIVAAQVAAAPAGVAGVVRERRGGRPLAGAVVLLPGEDRRTVTGADGRYSFADVPPGSQQLEARSSGFLTLETEIVLDPGETAEVPLQLLPIPLARDEIDVTSRPFRFLGEGLSTLSLVSSELASLPDLASDVLRPIARLPGTVSSELSAQVHVRGGREDELSVRLDGLEIVEPYHLQDFGSALSILAPATVGSVELLTGGFSVEYGDRMSGVLDMTSVDPAWRRRAELGWSPIDATASGSGTVRQGRGRWLAAARRGLLELPLKLVEKAENPGFWDVFGKLEQDLGVSQSLRFELLAAGDRLDFTRGELSASEPGEDDGEPLERFRTEYRNVYGWISHQAVSRRDLYAESRVSWSHIERDRGGLERDEAGHLTLGDARELDVAGLAQDWSFQANERHDLKWGFELKSLDVSYDYVNERTLVDPLAAIRYQPPVGVTRFDERFRGRQYGVYLADRSHPLPALSLEAGVRLDENELTEDHQLSPRANLAWEAGSASRLRFAWGMFHQSQRVYELRIEDGETSFLGAELTEQRIVGYERSFGARSGGRPVVLRAELYERRIGDPRPRFENLFDPVSIVPELEADRVRIASERSLARGLELFASGAAGPRLDWFVSYAYTSVRDRIDGRGVPRSIDQPHTFGLDLHYRSPWRWDFDLAAEAHSGWPTTAITARRIETGGGQPEILPELGPLYGERLRDYYRLDLKASRTWQWKRRELAFFFVVHNLTDTKNVRGFDVAFEPLSDGRVRVVREAKYWAGILPSFGLRWSF